jgi:hypothetical protein
LQVRLNPDEFEAIERIAADRGTPTPGGTSNAF